ncbi:DUF3429 domain-containing protein [Marinomonas ostreistagni]|uniref:DUF3429 domain-containing protein n=1 Tax=Marinomonas ostreistagni TaxID=359209 RepID=A0ABS0Z7W3_9GAMM|nr:DUF3429 domain-containing protein [Marinomonas ostreistagni]MBJ7549740.1 DUF3429 domain-containing protein [Marinomonas ostreistagni]
MRNSSSTVIKVLGYLGLIPFVVSTLTYLFDFYHYSFHAQTAFIAYSAVILSFLSGAIWGQVIEQAPQSKGKALLIGSNVIAIAGWLGLIIEQPHLSLLLLLGGYISIFWLEVRWLKAMRPDQSYYPNLRFFLTVLVCAMHLLMLYPKF